VGLAQGEIQLQHGVQQAADPVNGFVVGFRRVAAEQTLMIEASDGFVGGLARKREVVRVARKQVQMDEEGNDLSVTTGVGSPGGVLLGVAAIPRFAQAGPRGQVGLKEPREELRAFTLMM
jgi:hypothetical protein